jgi:hypothetical protein
MTHFLGERGRWDSQHRAPGVGQAVAADLAANHPGQRPAVPCPTTSRSRGEAILTRTQPASPRSTRSRTGGSAGIPAPRRGERIPQALMGIFRPDAAQVATP